MGLYDSVKISQVWCYHCGAEIFDKYWQTKDGDSLLDTYESLDSFFEKEFKLYRATFLEKCSHCGQYADIVFYNTTDVHQKYRDEENEKFRISLKRRKDVGNDPEYS